MGKTQILGSLVNTILTDSSNNVGLGGAANASFKLQVTGATNLTGALSGTSATFSGTIITNTSAAADNNLRVQNSTNAYASAINLIANNDDGGRFNFINSSTNGGTIHWQIGGGSVTNTMIFYTNNNAERMRISSAGNVSIGTTNTSARLNIQASANFENATLGTATGTMGYLAANGLYGMYIGIGNSGNTWLQSQRNDGSTDVYSLLLNPRGGNVGIGTSSPTGAAGLALVLNSGANQGRICIKTSATGDASGAGLQIGMSGVDAFIEQRENAALAFATNASERIRITASGNLLIGGSSDISTRLYIIAASGNAAIRAVCDAGQNALSIGGTGNISVDFPGVGGGRFQLDGNGNVYNRTGVYGTVSSDRRLKENITLATSKLSDILRLNVVNFNLIGSQEKQIGFIAQEMKEVFPSFVYEKDTREYDAKGNVISGYEDSLGVKVGMEFAILVKAIQELEARIKQLENK
jgi:hypothetical protein